MDFEDLLDKAENALVVQEQRGGLENNPYLQGMLNGMAFVLAIIRDEAPPVPDSFLEGV